MKQPPKRLFQTVRVSSRSFDRHVAAVRRAGPGVSRAAATARTVAAAAELVKRHEARA